MQKWQQNKKKLLSRQLLVLRTCFSMLDKDICFTLDEGEPLIFFICRWYNIMQKSSDKVREGAKNTLRKVVWEGLSNWHGLWPQMCPLPFFYSPKYNPPFFPLLKYTPFIFSLRLSILPNIWFLLLSSPIHFLIWSTLHPMLSPYVFDLPPFTRL